MSAVRKAQIAPEEYLEGERLAPTRSEYVRGEIWGMAGAKPVHNLITLNIGGELRTRLKGKPCIAYSSDQKVQAGHRDAYFYPDVSVVCGQPILLDGTDDVITNPTLVVEVLSPTTQRYDKEAKFADYALLPSLKEYVLVSADRRLVTHSARQPNGQWLVTFYLDAESVMLLPSLNVELPLSEIYDRVEFEPAL